MSEADAQEVLDRAEKDWASLANSTDVRQFLALIDGEPVATGRSTYTDVGVLLNGGSTIESARGRGAYRALVRARWEEGRRRGTPALVTQAGAQSRPILSGLGFVEVAEIRVLLDGPAAA